MAVSKDTGERTVVTTVWVHVESTVLHGGPQVPA